MTNEQLSASLSYLGDELLAECGARRQRPKRSWRTALILSLIHISEPTRPY